MRLLGFIALVALVGLVTWAACSPTCDSSNCVGCCAPGGICNPGTDAKACGKFGETCQACASGQSCNGGVCGGADGGAARDGGAGCNAANCGRGCCIGGSCVPYTQQTGNFCGTGGQACQACDLVSQTCQLGACVSGCGQNNCGGCCASSTCIPLASQGGAQSVSQCGYGGEVCHACPSGQQCSDEGLCVLILDAGVADGGSADAGPHWDYPCGNYPPCLLSQQCCTTISGTNVSFGCVSSCPSQADVIACDGPEECPTGQVCCGIETVNGGTSPNCQPTAVGATCMPAASCPTQFANNCQGSNQIVICHTSIDCAADPNSNNCCAFSQGGATLTFCASLDLALFADQCF